MCYLRRNYDHAGDLLLKSKVLPAQLFITQHSLTRNFDVVKTIAEIEIGRQLVHLQQSTCETKRKHKLNETDS